MGNILGPNFTTETNKPREIHAAMVNERDGEICIESDCEFNNKLSLWSQGLKSECSELYRFFSGIKNRSSLFSGSGSLMGIGGIPTMAGMIKVFERMETKNIPEQKRIVLEFGSSTGFSSAVYFAAILDFKVWGFEVNTDSYNNSLTFKKYLSEEQYKEVDIPKLIEDFEIKNPGSSFELINRKNLLNIGNKIRFHHTLKNQDTLDRLNETDNWKNNITIIYAFCDGVNEVDLRWHIHHIWNKIKSLRYLITTYPIISIDKLKNLGFNSKYN
jgi:hypothetical protein